jgi:hypothetical protein
MPKLGGVELELAAHGHIRTSPMLQLSAVAAWPARLGVGSSALHATSQHALSAHAIAA